MPERILPNRERWKIVLVFAWLGPLVGGLVVALPISLLPSDPGISRIEGVLGVLFFSYPIGLIPATMTGCLVQWALAWTMQRTMPLNRAKGFLLGAAAGLLTSFVLAACFVDFRSMNWSAGNDLSSLLLFTVPGAVAGGVCALVALRRLQRKNLDASGMDTSVSSVQAET